MTITWRSSVLLLAALAAAACSPQAPKFRSTDITGADFGKELALTGHDGKPRTLADFRGQAIVLFFGYTHCPDVCPATLADMAGVMKKLGREAERVQVLFVTLDPERDTPAVLRQYLGSFSKDFVGLFGSPEALAPLLHSLAANAMRQAVPGGSYQMAHSATLYLLDTRGRLAAVYTPPLSSAILIADLRTVAQASLL